MRNLVKLADKFANILQDHNYVNDFDGGFYDPTGYARKALNLGNKYPANQKAEGVLPDGSLVRLLSQEEARNLGTAHRLQIRCKYCEHWIPAGRLAQHESPCARRNAPGEYKSKMDFKQRVKDTWQDIRQDNDYQSKIDKTLVLMDMIEESGDPRWFANIGQYKNDIILWRARQIMDQNNIGSGIITSQERDGDRVIYKIQLGENRYKLTVNPDGSYKLILLEIRRFI